MQKGSAHVTSLIILDFTVLEVCDTAFIDQDASALPKKECEHVTFQRGAGGKVQEEFKKRSAHPLLSKVRYAHKQAHMSNVPAGRWRKGAGKVQKKASTEARASLFVIVQSAKSAVP